MIEDEADILWPVDSAIQHVNLLAVMVVVRDGAVKAYEVTWDGNREAVHGQVDLVVTRFRAGRRVGVGAEDSGGDGTGGFVFVVDAGCEGKVQARDERRRRGIVLRQLHELIQADFAKNHLKALKCFVEVDLLKCDRLLSQL
jgi:hypothetical protein